MRHEILPGLPPYGPAAVPFTDTPHSEGLVVRFHPNDGEPWVGNFGRQRFQGLDLVRDHPNGYDMIVVAGGRGYVVDIDSRTIRETIGGEIHGVISVPSLNAIVIADRFAFQAYRRDGLWWRTSCDTWDGIRNIQVSGHELLAEIFSPDGDQWHPVTFDLLTGQSSDLVCEVRPGLHQRAMGLVGRIRSALGWRGK